MKVYIAGQIAGDKDYVNKFATAEDLLIWQGFKVLNPAVLPEGLEPADYMRICQAMMDSADCVVLLPDWEYSKGAKLEAKWCEYTGKPAVVWEPAMLAADVAKLVRERTLLWKMQQRP